MMGYGFRIRRNWDRVSPEIVAAFRDLPVANVSDCMARIVAGGPALRPMHRDGVLAGPALTVRTRPGDNLMIHKAIAMAQPGDVIVVDGGGDLTNALIGELMLAQAVKRGVAGFVLNGAVRDRDAFPVVNLPVYAAGVTHRGPYKDGPGEIGFTIGFAGLTIDPGDLVLGDADGVLSVPTAEAAAILEATRAKQAAEQVQMAAIEAGTLDIGWIDAALESKGCEFVD
jgi:RraA family protein